MPNGSAVTSRAVTGDVRASDHDTTGLRLSVYSDASGIGGAEISLCNLLAALRPETEVTVLATSREVGALLAAARPGTSLAVVPSVRGKADLPGFLALRRAIARTRPDVFQANLHSLHSCQYALAAAESLRGVAVIAVEHSLVAPDTRLSRWLKRRTSRRLSAHVAVGDAAAREVERRVRLGPGSVRTIYNGVPADQNSPGRAKPSADGPPVVGTLARLDPIKGLDTLIDSLALLPGVHLVVAGEGPERERLQHQAERLGVADRVRFLGWVDDARRLFGGFDLFVLPSRSESFPLAVIEAMLAGLAVVATDVGSVAEAVVPGVTGLLVPPGDPHALGAAVESLLSDSHRRTEMGMAGRERALELYGDDSMARSYERLHDTVVGRLP